MNAATETPPNETEQIPPGLDGEDPEDRPDPEVVIEGTSEQLSMFAGGDEPLASEMRLAGTSVNVDGEFAKGEVMTLQVQVYVAEVAFSDKRDRTTGEVIDTVRRHVVKPMRPPVRVDGDAKAD